ncbi:hypothetical protein Scep_014989 [Stephania cephalantha]|uniref:Secreted protein n=1 Tax=Stephania cephalantha TaxID=152367 RepID=A0AAP0P0Z1_9MAGN
MFLLFLAVHHSIQLFGRGLRLLPRISLLCVHEALDCITCDPALSEWRPGLALVHVSVTQRNWPEAARDQVLGQLDATTGGNLVTRSTV